MTHRVSTLQATELERCGPFEFAAAVNLALGKGGAPQSPLDPLLSSLRPALGPLVGIIIGVNVSDSNNWVILVRPLLLA